MFEKVNPGHPDKMADRLAGAIVDLAYERAGGLATENPRVAVEVLAGHGRVTVQVETSLSRQEMRAEDIDPLIYRIFGANVWRNVVIAAQDAHLSDNQMHGLRCGDNGIFKGCPTTDEQQLLTDIAGSIYQKWPWDGKYIIERADHYYDDAPANTYNLTICQSHATHKEVLDVMDAWFIENYCKKDYPIPIVKSIINPLGPWTGGPDVDCGATNRKLGSDMGDGVTGGGLMGKDLSKADVSVNIVCHLLAKKHHQEVTAMCSIGDEQVTFHLKEAESNSRGSGAPCDPITIPFADIVEQARQYIQMVGGFEKFAEWGLIRPQQ